MSLPDGLSSRALQADDIHRGYMQLLRQLTTAVDVTPEQFAAQLARMEAAGCHVLVVVDAAADRVVGTATLLVEHKLVHGCGAVGHVEDVVVDAAQRGRRLGEFLLRAQCRAAGERGCYKVILDCADANCGFYERCGFRRCEVEMRYDVPTPAPTPSA
jgi:glucosamine-phosphate N-acetyltransferase